MSSIASTFHFSVTSSSGEELDLTISKTFSKITIFGCSASTKIIQWPQFFNILQTLSVLPCVPSFSLCVWFIRKLGEKMVKNVENVAYNSFSLLQRCPLKIPINTFHCHYKIYLYAKYRPSRPRFPLQTKWLWVRVPLQTFIFMLFYSFVFFHYYYFYSF